MAITIAECTEEAQRIIKELEDIESGVKADFLNVGEDLCGEYLRRVAGSLKIVKKLLEAAEDARRKVI